MTGQTHTARHASRHGGEALLRELRELQQKGRLAIHMNECSSGLEWPEYLWEGLNLDPKDIASMIRGDASLGDPKRRLISMSLVPPIYTKNGKQISIEPYESKASKTHSVGYLFDMSADQESPPLVVRSSNYSINSGPDIFDKKLRIGEKFYDPFGLYEGGYSTEQSLFDAIAAGKGQQHTSYQLNAMAAYYLEDSCENGTVHDCNEIFVAAAAPHVRAIIIPSYARDTKDNLPNYNAQLYRLTGALVGLEHIARGVAGEEGLPVVFYHVTGKQQGDFSYLGKGKAQLTAIAADAVRELNTMNAWTNPGFNRVTDKSTLNGLLREHLGFDMESSAEERKQVLTALPTTLNRPSIQR